MKLVPSQEREMCESVSVEERLAKEGIYEKGKRISITNEADCIIGI